MIVALALAAVLSQRPPDPRPEPDALYCAAISVMMAEAEQAKPTPDPDSEAAIYTLMLYFLGRVEGPRPTPDATDRVLDRAEALTISTVPPADILACAAVLQTQGERLAGRAAARGRPLR